jgi:hypothetical protein
MKASFVNKALGSWKPELGEQSYKTAFFKGYCLGRMPVFIKHDELNQYILKYIFRWSLSTYILGGVKGFWQHA